MVATCSPGYNPMVLEFTRRIVSITSNRGDTLWEPFGGLCTAAVAAVECGRNAFAAEPNEFLASLAKQRLAEEPEGEAVSSFLMAKGRPGSRPQVRVVIGRISSLREALPRRFRAVEVGWIVELLAELLETDHPSRFGLPSHRGRVSPATQPHAHPPCDRARLQHLIVCRPGLELAPVPTVA